VIFLSLSFLSAFHHTIVHDWGEKQLTFRRYFVFDVLLVLLAVYTYLAYTHLGLNSSGNASGAPKVRDKRMLPMAKHKEYLDFLFNSGAYDTLRAELFDLVHRWYEFRIQSAIGGDLEQSGVRLGEDATYCIAQEVSWVPVNFLTFSDDANLSYADATKAYIEEHMGESWNWWPLAPRQYRLRPRYCRLEWKSVCDSSPFLYSSTVRLTSYTSHAERLATLIFRRASRKPYSKLSELRHSLSILTSPLAHLHTRRVGMEAVRRAPMASYPLCHSLA
jgi:hypothetical protein